MQASTSFTTRKKVVPKKTIYTQVVGEKVSRDSLDDTMRAYSEDKENKSQEDSSSTKKETHQRNTQYQEEFGKLLKELETKNFLVEHLTQQLKQAQETIFQLQRQVKESHEENRRILHSKPPMREQGTQSDDIVSNNRDEKENEMEPKTSNAPSYSKKEEPHFAAIPINYEYQFTSLAPPLAASILQILFGKKSSFPFSLHWKSSKEDKLVLDNGEYIFGKNAIIRYLIRKHSLPIYLFDHPISSPLISVDEFENILEVISSMRCEHSKEKSLLELEELVKRSPGDFFFGNQVSLADILAWESIKHIEKDQKRKHIEYSETITKWYKSMDELSICTYAVELFYNKSPVSETKEESPLPTASATSTSTDQASNLPSESTSTPTSPMEHSSVDFTFVLETENQSPSSGPAFDFEASAPFSFPSSNPTNVFTSPAPRKILKARRSNTKASAEVPQHAPPTTQPHVQSPVQQPTSEARRFIKPKRSLRTSQNKERPNGFSSSENVSFFPEVDMADASSTTDPEEKKEPPPSVSNQEPKQKSPDKTGKEESQRYRDMGNRLYKEGKYLESLSFYDRAITLDPQNYLNYGNRAAALYMIGKLKDSLSDCEKALEINPHYIKCLVRAGKCHTQLGNVDKAIECLVQAEKYPGQGDEMKEEIKTLKKVKEKLQQAEESLQKGNYQQALELLDSTIAVSPRLIEPQLLKAKALLCLQEYHQLHVLLDTLSTREILQTKQLQLEIAYFRIAAFYKDGEFETAKRLLEVSLKSHVNEEKLISIQKKMKDLESKKQQGNEAFAKENYKLAYQLYSEALEIDDVKHFNKTLYSNRAAVSVKLENFREALKDCNKSIELDPNFMKPVLRRSQIFLTLEMYEHAVADLQKVLQADKSNSEVRQSLALAQAALRKMEEKDYYSFLEVEKDATEEVIKKAYKKKALVLHPDKNSDTPELKEHAEKWFKFLGEAYSTLSDPLKRNQYDLKIPTTKSTPESYRNQENRKNKSGYPFRNFSQKPKDREPTGDYRRKYQYY